MRPLLLAALAFAIPSTFGAELNLPLTPETLPYWSLSGAKRADLATTPLTLPPGAQVSRVFTTDRLGVRIETAPIFALDPEDWAVLEVGEAALVFARDGDTGYLALTVGTAEVALHPRTVPLAEEGGAAVSVKATLQWQADQVSLEVDGERIDLPVPPPQQLAVTVSSGKKAPWPFDRLSVVLPINDQDLPHGLRDGDDPEATARASGLVAPKTARDAVGMDAATPGAGEGARDANAVPSDYRPLEIYTPPAVRTQRAEQIKAAVNARRQL